MPSNSPPPRVDKAARQQLLDRLDGRPIVLVGMMGAGKTTVGRRLAARLGRSFLDSDNEIETAAGMSVPEIFAARGEAEFRAGEARVIARILKGRNLVLATGGGAFMDPATRDQIAEHAVSIWLKADLDVLFTRVSRRANRPLLKTDNPKARLAALIDERYPVYALADITVHSHDVPHDAVTDSLILALSRHLGLQPAGADFD